MKACRNQQKTSNATGALFPHCPGVDGYARLTSEVLDSEAFADFLLGGTVQPASVSRADPDGIDEFEKLRTRDLGDFVNGSCAILRGIAAQRMTQTSICSTTGEWQRRDLSD
jgi:hypothetical protein